MRRVLCVLGLCVLGLVSVAEAQTPGVIPFRYRVTRTAAGQPANTFLFLKSDMQCALPSAEPAAGALRIEDPASPALDCQYSGSSNNWTGLAVGVAYTFTIAGCNADGQCGPESLPVSEGVPGAPGRPRLTPGFTGVEVAGIVSERYPFAGLDVFRADLAQFGPGFSLYVGAPTLSAPSYAVQAGDRFSLVLWRDPVR